MSKRIEDLDTNFKDTAPRIDGAVQWVRATDPRVTVNGLPWFRENGGEFFRLPVRVKGKVREPVWELGTMPSGGRVRFKTDSANLKLRIKHSRAETAMAHMCSVGVSGIDLYEGPPDRMVYWTSSKAIKPREIYEVVYLANLPRQMREFTLYLPTYNDLVHLEIGLDADAKIEKPSPFRLAKPVVIYGTSITQGGCSSRGANGYVPLVGRMLGVDVINLGFSGNGRSDLEVAELMTEIDAACYVNDCVANMNIEGMKERYEAFNAILRTKRPEVPLLFMTSIHFGNENYLDSPRHEETNAFVKATYEKFRARDPGKVHFLECRDIISAGPDHPSVDGAHLTDLGYWRMAQGMAPVLGKIVGL